MCVSLQNTSFMKFCISIVLIRLNDILLELVEMSLDIRPFYSCQESVTSSDVIEMLLHLDHFGTLKLSSNL